MRRELFQRSGLAPHDLRAEHITPLLSPLRRIFPDEIERPVDQVFNHLTKDPEPVEDVVWGLMIETRPHPALHTVLASFMERCGIRVQLFHGRGNRDFILSGPGSAMAEDGRLRLTELDISDKIGLGFYNRLLLSRRLWEQCLGRNKVLVLQTDALACPQADYELTDFMDLDYVGSRWPRSRPVGLTIDGGSGGLSLRDWSKTVTCLERFPATRWPAGEDGYFGFHLELMGARVATMAEAGRFSTQDVFTDRSFGCHQISRLSDQDLVRFLEFCPEATAICPDAIVARAQGSQTVSAIPTAEPTTQANTEDFQPRGSMFISTKYNMLFFEVPRTGSNSVTQRLNHLDPESPTISMRGEHGGGWSYHHESKALDTYPDFRLVAAHRNPYDRLWSFWKHRKQSGNPESFRGLSWKRYIDWVCDPTSVPEVKGAMSDKPISEMIDTARVDYWLDFHRMDGSWLSICEALGLPWATLPQLNASPDHGAMQMAFNAELAARVAERFAADFEFFGYDTNSWQSGSAVASCR